MLRARLSTLRLFQVARQRIGIMPPDRASYLIIRAAHYQDIVQGLWCGLCHRAARGVDLPAREQECDQAHEVAIAPPSDPEEIVWNQ